MPDRLDRVFGYNVGQISFGNIASNLGRSKVINLLELFMSEDFCVGQISFGKSYLISSGWIPGSKNL